MLGGFATSAAEYAQAANKQLQSHANALPVERIGEKADGRHVERAAGAAHRPRLRPVLSTPPYACTASPSSIAPSSDATSNEPQMPSAVLLYDLGRATHRDDDYRIILSAVWQTVLRSNQRPRWC